MYGCSIQVFLGKSMDDSYSFEDIITSFAYAYKAARKEGEKAYHEACKGKKGEGEVAGKGIHYQKDLLIRHAEKLLSGTVSFTAMIWELNWCAEDTALEIIASLVQNGETIDKISCGAYKKRVATPNEVMAFGMCGACALQFEPLLKYLVDGSYEADLVSAVT